MSDHIWDSVLHLFMGIGIALVFAPLFSLMLHTGGSGWWDGVVFGAMVGAFCIVFREACQHSAKFGNDFFKGWAVWEWGRGRHIEAWPPAAATLLIGLVTAVLLRLYT